MPNERIRLGSAQGAVPQLIPYRSGANWMIPSQSDKESEDEKR